MRVARVFAPLVFFVAVLTAFPFDFFASTDNGDPGNRGSDDTILVSFSFNALIADGVVDQENGTVTVVVPFGTDLTGLVPTIGIDARRVSPASDVAQDFTNPVTYTVTSFSGLTRDYAVTVEVDVDLRLDSLVLTAGEAVTLDPAFDGNQLTHRAGVVTSVETITVTASAIAEDDAEVTIDPTPTAGSIPLVEGANPIRITVTNPARGTTRTYSVTVDRAFVLGMVSVPGGSFQRDETPANVSTVTGRADPSRTEYSTGLDNPVQSVSWFEALLFANRLSLREHLGPVYTIGVSTGPDAWPAIPTASDQSNLAAWNAVEVNWGANGYRLLTEMEWMWAAMGADVGAVDATNTTGWAKPFAGSSGIDSIGDHAWYVENSNNTTRRVGTRSANELGLFDMSGNVKEWVWDRHQPTLPGGALSSDYSGLETGELRVLRGGAFRDPAGQVTVASHAADRPYGTGGRGHRGRGYRAGRWSDGVD